MQQEIQVAIEGIVDLKQNTDYLKDYLFPIASAFFAAFLGATVAYFTFRHQELIQIEKEKIIETNKWLLSVQEAFLNLMSIKNNYREQLQSDEPIQRIFQLPTILNQAKPLNESLASLSFVVPKKANKNQKNNEWRQLPKIGAMSSNYNHILMLWAKQAELERPIKNVIAGNNPYTAVSNIKHEDLIKIIGIPALASLADLTELVLVSTDDLLLEMNDFLLEFPKVAKSEIQTKRLQSFGTLLSFETDDNNERLNASLKRVTQVDYTKLSSLLGESLEYVENKFSPRYLVDIKENIKA